MNIKLTKKAQEFIDQKSSELKKDNVPEPYAIGIHGQKLRS
ncbi:MAG: hypothetical protein ACTSRP_10125 [Candidatus Helarchaeota archaeon]